MSTRKAILHIGSHKTGTTAIQHALSVNRNSLKKQGYFFPRSCEWPHDHSHNLLAFSMINWKKTGERLMFDSQLKELEDEILDNNNLNMIFSSEMLEKLVISTPDLLVEFLHMLKKYFDEINIIYCMRDEISHCNSVFKQHVQGNVFKGTPKDFVEKFKYKFDFLNIALLWRNTNLIKNIDSFWYSENYDDNFILFSRIIGLNPAITNHGILNKSLNGKLLELKLALNKNIINQDQNNFITNEFRHLFNKLDQGWQIPKTIFDECLQKEFMKYYSTIDYSNQQIMKIHNNKTISNNTLPSLQTIDRETAILYANDLSNLGHKHLAKFILDILSA